MFNQSEMTDILQTSFILQHALGNTPHNKTTPKTHFGIFVIHVCNLVPYSRFIFRAGVSLNIHSFIHSLVPYDTVSRKLILDL